MSSRPPEAHGVAWSDLPFVGAAALAAGVVLYLGRSLTFWHDEWRSITFDGELVGFPPTRQRALVDVAARSRIAPPFTSSVSTPTCPTSPRWSSSTRSPSRAHTSSFDGGSADWPQRSSRVPSAASRERGGESLLGLPDGVRRLRRVRCVGPRRASSNEGGGRRSRPRRCCSRRSCLPGSASSSWSPRPFARCSIRRSAAACSPSSRRSPRTSCGTPGRGTSPSTTSARSRRRLEIGGFVARGVAHSTAAVTGAGLLPRGEIVAGIGFVVALVGLAWAAIVHRPRPLATASVLAIVVLYVLAGIGPGAPRLRLRRDQSVRLRRRVPPGARSCRRARAAARTRGGRAHATGALGRLRGRRVRLRDARERRASTGRTGSSTRPGRPHARLRRPRPGVPRRALDRSSRRDTA